MRFRGLRLVGGMLAALLLSGSVSPASALTNADKIKLVEAEQKNPPMAFFVVKGAPDSCGAGCDQWIAADGHIDPDAAQRLRQLFQKIGKSKLPIYFNSPGGDLHQAIEIGRMLRARGMTAGVARTLAAKCVPLRSVEECATSIRSHPETEAVLWTDNARCLSACPLALIGAPTREIAPDALLGVHSTFVYFAHPPRVATQSQLDRASEKGMQRLENTFSNYVAEMKLSKELFRLIWSTKFQDMHYLTRAELFDLGIDRRESVESGWHFGYQPVPAVGSAAFLNLPGKSEDAAVKKMPVTLIVSCDARYLGSFLLTSLQQIPNPSMRQARDLRVSAGASGATLTYADSFLTTYKDQTFEVRQQRTARTVIEALMKASAITIAEQPQPSDHERTPSSDTSTAQFGIPGTGGAGSLKTLVAHCAQPQSVTARLTVPPSANNVFVSLSEGPSTGWRFAFLPVASVGSAAFATAFTATFQQMVLAISCSGGGTYTVSTVQRLPNSPVPRTDIVIGDESLGLLMPATTSSTKTWKGDPYDVRQAKWSRSVVESLLASPAITVRKKLADVGVPSSQYSFSAKGAQDALKALADYCRMLN
jgi:hypothetical protein